MKHIGGFGLSALAEGDRLSEAPVPRKIAVRPVA